MFLGLLVAVVLLWLSMRKQLKKVDFEEDPGAEKPADRPGPGQNGSPQNNASHA